MYVLYMYKVSALTRSAELTRYQDHRTMAGLVEANALFGHTNRQNHDSYVKMLTLEGNINTCKRSISFPRIPKSVIVNN